MLTRSKIGTKMSIQTLVKISLLASVAAVLMYFEFPLFFAPPFMKVDISEVPGLIGGFALGPLAGALIVLLKLILKMFLKASTTLGVGELSNLIVSTVFVVTASTIYAKKKTFKRALISLIAATVAMAVVATVSNYFFIFPMYIKMMGKSAAELVQKSAGANPFVKDYLSLMLLSVFPFNIAKGTIVSIVAMLLYKPVSPILKRS